MTPIVRMASPEMDQLCNLAFRRYPFQEWGTFARFGWRATAQGLILTLAHIDEPVAGDLLEDVGNVAFTESYSLRVALDSETHPLAIGVIHSHPEDCIPRPSRIDDDMDGYFSDYFEGFAPRRPYVSLILSKIGDRPVIGGRVYWQDRWLQVRRFSVERSVVSTWTPRRSVRNLIHAKRIARLTAAFGDEAGDRLRESTVAVVGAGGTGSAAIEVLARAGVGHLVLVDPDVCEESNLERIHGSRPKHATDRALKVAVARDHVRTIDPGIKVSALVGSLPQSEVVDVVVAADVALGCTDRQHSRLALSDIALRYLVPSIDCGVLLEGKDGVVTGQTAQLVRFLAADACALCRGMIDPIRVTQELMSEEERTQRRAAAADAAERGDQANPYWRDVPQLNTVGYLTTMAGAMAAGYAIGWLTGKFDPPFRRLQMNLLQPFFDVTDCDEEPRALCVCRRVRGWADQGVADALLSAPEHWPPVLRVGAGHSRARPRSRR